MKKDMQLTYLLKLAQLFAPRVSRRSVLAGVGAVSACWFISSVIDNRFIYWLLKVAVDVSDTDKNCTFGQTGQALS